MSQARGTVSVDDDRVRVTTWTFESAGTATGRHRHEFDYVIVPITGGTFTVIDLDGSERDMEQVAGRRGHGGNRARRRQCHRPGGRLRRDRAQALSSPPVQFVGSRLNLTRRDLSV